MRGVLAAVLCGWAAVSVSADAAAAAPPRADAGPGLGHSATGDEIDAARLRGRVVLVFHWSTRCPVCMDKWPELRANARGWAGKPFTLVAVNVDDVADWRDYERSVALVQPHAVNVISLHAPVRPPRLPTTVVLDTQGRVVSRVEGRWPAAMWDDLALLLP